MWIVKRKKNQKKKTFITIVTKQKCKVISGRDKVKEFGQNPSRTQAVAKV
jgi:hypothetical protein